MKSPQNISPHNNTSYNSSVYIYDVFIMFFKGLVKYTYEYYDDNSNITTTHCDVFEIDCFSFDESNINKQTSVSQRNSNFDSRYKFTTKACPTYWRELDTETGYTYFGARYYDSDASIWLSVDPLAGKYPSLSPYAYCAGNPVMSIDPDGMDIVPINKEGRAAIIAQFAKYSDKVIEKVFKLTFVSATDNPDGYEKFSSDIITRKEASHLSGVNANEIIKMKDFKRATKLNGTELDEAWALYKALIGESEYLVEGVVKGSSYTLDPNGTSTSTIVDGIPGFRKREAVNSNLNDAIHSFEKTSDLDEFFNDPNADARGNGYVIYRNNSFSKTQGTIMLDSRVNNGLGGNLGAAINTLVP